MSPLLSLILVIYFVAAALMLGLHYAFASERTDAIKIYPNKERRLSFAARAKNIGGNMAMSAIVFVVAAVLIPHRLYDPSQAGWLRVLGETLAILALYDFLYYFMHRYAFHEWKWMRGVHVQHHTNKTPVVAESLFAHPLEIALGVVLFLGCALVVGPVSLWSFAGAFSVFTFFNLLIHSGLSFEHPLLRPIAYINRKHARHHASMRAGNYASISPLPDILFGTAE